jgi:hypothetical protein
LIVGITNSQHSPLYLSWNACQWPVNIPSPL